MASIGDSAGHRRPRPQRGSARNLLRSIIACGVFVLAACGEPAMVLELSGELDASLLHPDTGKEYVGVVMPMRI